MEAEVHQKAEAHQKQGDIVPCFHQGVESSQETREKLIVKSGFALEVNIEKKVRFSIQDHEIKPRLLSVLDDLDDLVHFVFAKPMKIGRVLSWVRTSVLLCGPHPWLRHLQEKKETRQK